MLGAFYILAEKKYTFLAGGVRPPPPPGHVFYMVGFFFDALP